MVAMLPWSLELTVTWQGVMVVNVQVLNEDQGMAVHSLTQSQKENGMFQHLCLAESHVHTSNCYC